MNIERLTPKLVPGWDCRNDNANCKSCNWLTSQGRKRDDHGIHGDEFIFGIRTEMSDGRIAAITLEIFTGRYPATVPQSVVGAWPFDRFPYGASLDLHLQVPKDGKGPYEHSIVHDECEWLGPGRRCYADGSGLVAEDIYKRCGVQSDDPDVDLTKQSDALYEEMARFLQMWTVGK